MVTIKRVDLTSAMRVGALVYAMTFTIFGLLWVALQSVFLAGLNGLVGTSVTTVNGQVVPLDLNGLATASLAGCGCMYVIGVVSAAVGGALFGLIIAFCYNLTANWFGGLRLSVQRDDMDKMKRAVVEDDPF
ncbi:MAG: DUF3566 domain-containing protein [Anaerolineae bacterium]